MPVSASGQFCCQELRHNPPRNLNQAYSKPTKGFLPFPVQGSDSLQGNTRMDYLRANLERSDGYVHAVNKYTIEDATSRERCSQYYRSASFEQTVWDPRSRGEKPNLEQGPQLRQLWKLIITEASLTRGSKLPPPTPWSPKSASSSGVSTRCWATVPTGTTHSTWPRSQPRHGIWRAAYHHESQIVWARMVTSAIAPESRNRQHRLTADVTGTPVGQLALSSSGGTLLGGGRGRQSRITWPNMFSLTNTEWWQRPLAGSGQSAGSMALWRVLLPGSDDDEKKDQLGQQGSQDSRLQGGYNFERGSDELPGTAHEEHQDHFNQ